MKYSNNTPDITALYGDLSPGTHVRWEGRSEPLLTVYVDRKGENPGTSYDHWPYTEVAVFKSKRGAYFRLARTGARSVRIYRDTNDRWDYGWESEGSPHHFEVVEAPPWDGAPGDLAAGDLVVDKLHPNRLSVVEDPADVLGQVVVRPYRPEDAPLPYADAVPYAVTRDEVLVSSDPV